MLLKLMKVFWVCWNVLFDCEFVGCCLVLVELRLRLIGLLKFMFLLFSILWKVFVFGLKFLVKWIVLFGLFLIGGVILVWLKVVWFRVIGLDLEILVNDILVDCMFLIEVLFGLWCKSNDFDLKLGCLVEFFEFD